jgi:hypothetical protein
MERKEGRKEDKKSSKSSSLLSSKTNKAAEIDSIKRQGSSPS